MSHHYYAENKITWEMKKKMSFHVFLTCMYACDTLKVDQNTIALTDMTAETSLLQRVTTSRFCHLSLMTVLLLISQKPP